MMNMNKKSQIFGLIYQNQCVECSKEGTYGCHLKIEKESCKNFEKKKKNKIIFICW